MNALLTASREWLSMADLPTWAMLLIKMTSLLLAAWLAHLMLGRTNPRWRVFLWRVTAIGLIGLPAVPTAGAVTRPSLFVAVLAGHSPT